MLILEIAAGVALGLFIFYKLYSATKDENEAVAEWQKKSSRELPLNPPHKYTGHPHGCPCQKCLSWVDVDHAEYMESKKI